MKNNSSISLLDHLACQYGVEPSVILGPGKAKNSRMVMARRTMVLWYHEFQDRSIDDISKTMILDRSTIMYYIRQLQKHRYVSPSRRIIARWLQVKEHLSRDLPYAVYLSEETAVLLTACGYSLDDVDAMIHSWLNMAASIHHVKQNKGG